MAGEDIRRQKCRYHSGRYVQQQSRSLDYMYDPLYTVSGQKDLVKSVIEGDLCLQKPVHHQNFETMFCDGLDLSQGNVLPVKRDIEYSDRIYGPVPSYQSTTLPNVSGTDRYRYFTHPTLSSDRNISSKSDVIVVEVSSHQQIFPSYNNSKSIHVCQFTNDVKCDICHAEINMDHNSDRQVKTCNSSTQTMYRESEAQTDPYAPPYVALSKKQPELLNIEHFTWGQGLPAGEEEVDLIHKIRHKEKLISNLPTIDVDNESDKVSKQRARKVAEIKLQDWINREQEVEKIQTFHMQLLADKQEHENINSTEKMTERLNRILTTANQNKERKLKVTAASFVRNMKHLNLKYHLDKDSSFLKKHGHQKYGFKKSGKPIGIIKNEADYSSNGFGAASSMKDPKIRSDFAFGALNKYISNYIEKVEGLDVLQFSGLMDSEWSITPKCIQSSPSLDQYTKGDYIPRALRISSTLKQLQEGFIEQRDNSSRINDGQSTDGSLEKKKIQLMVGNNGIDGKNCLHSQEPLD